MTPLALIRDYYRRIDAQDVAAVLALFRPDAVYKRAGARFHGLAELERFFAKDRKIRGVHEIEALWGVDNRVIATGAFKGVSGDGAPREIEFVDLWWFADDGLVERRETFLAHGYQLVQD
jgi:steroid delta-isomerase